ncbi:allophanate hydrolase [Sulfurospirillum diekertiae]|uniref:Allophanate hydrolase n=1 Tax=Sulfurospirillum diekertiae TaxID=1854492 RepID=A0A6G9VS56_9BACT|nr:allophanate hydrolase [Sulfurospirillum diekertiae]QIR75797.1 allophanate hydrolase [Sulfurospirillum diekertiae]QIR78442.1 allophanate hydrolase [Sulfurospirillum diekertiae]
MTLLHVKQNYAQNACTPRELVQQIKERIAHFSDNPIWLHVLSDTELEPYLTRLEQASMEALPLYGVPFAIKDNIDLAGIPTTAACPDFTYVPERSAFVVEKLIEAGAIPIGKTNLDQFATGLVGTRSPYGACQNSIDSAYISGGSSSGSAVSVALDMVVFSLGTDTAGSGRVPAAFNNLCGFKASKGVVSTSGVVPACRSLDCVSLFCKEASDVSAIFEIMASFDEEDVYARALPPQKRAIPLNFTFGVPKASDLQFFGDTEAKVLFEKSIERLIGLGGVPKEIDFTPFLEAANLLYSGPWVSERYVATQTLLHTSPKSFLEVTRAIIAQGEAKKASEYFEAEYQLKAYRRAAEKILAEVDFCVTPTTGTIYTIEAIQADPITLNSNLGYYTNFMNLLDLAAYALPAGERSNHLPFGITIFADHFNDEALLEMGERYMKESI